MSKTFLKNLIFNNTSQGLQFGSRWVFNLVLIALLSNTDYGVFSYGLALSNILMAVLPFGSPVYLISATNEENKHKELSDSIVIVVVFFLISLFFYFLLFYLPINIKSFDILFYGLLLGFVLSLNFVIYYFLKSTGNFFEEIKASLFFFVLIFSFIVYLYFFKNNGLNIKSIFLILIILNAIISFYLLIFSKLIKLDLLFGNFKGSLLDLKTSVKKRFYFGLQEMMSASYTQLGMFIIFYFLSSEKYGLYRKLFVIVAPLYLLSVSLSQVLLHHLKNLDSKLIINEFRKYQKYTLLGALIVVLLVFIFRESLLVLLGKMIYSEETNKAFILVLFIVFIRFIYGNYEMLLVRIGKQNLRFWIMLVAAVANIVSIFVLVPIFGLIGAVLTNVLSNLLVLIGMWIVTEKYLKKI